jgi:hypothetical protein
VGRQVRQSRRLAPALLGRARDAGDHRLSPANLARPDHGAARRERRRRRATLEQRGYIEEQGRAPGPRVSPSSTPRPSCSSTAWAWPRCRTCRPSKSSCRRWQRPTNWPTRWRQRSRARRGTVVGRGRATAEDPGPRGIRFAPVLRDLDQRGSRDHRRSRRRTRQSRQDPEENIICVDGTLAPTAQNTVYFLLNKPDGVVTTASDPQGRTTVLDLVESPVRVFPGRSPRHEHRGTLDPDQRRSTGPPAHASQFGHCQGVPGPRGGRSLARPRFAACARAWSSTTA